MGKYASFRKRFDLIFDVIEDTNSISYQLIDLSDLFQKIAAIYAFATQHPHSAFHNSIIFQIVESSLFYGVCIPIRRLADGRQENEVSLFKIVQEIKSNCISWTREEFVTWDNQPYDTSELRRQHRAEIDRLIEENRRKGILATWVPRGKHEESDRRHEIFDFLSSTTAVSLRSRSDRWNDRVPRYLLTMLGDSTREITQFANRYLAHRVHPASGRKPHFEISLSKIEGAINSLYDCFNVLNTIFLGGHMTPNLVHQYDLFDKMGLALVEESVEQKFIDEYEAVKRRMEDAVLAYNHQWINEIEAFSK